MKPYNSHIRQMKAKPDSQPRHSGYSWEGVRVGENCKAIIKALGKETNYGKLTAPEVKVHIPCGSE